MLEKGVIISGGLFSVSESLFCGWIMIMVNPYYCVAIYVLYIHIHTYMIDRSIDRYNRAQSKCTKPWKQSSAIEQLLETLFLTINMCTGFTTDGICMSRMCAVLLANHIRAVAGAKMLMSKKCLSHKQDI